MAWKIRIEMEQAWRRLDRIAETMENGLPSSIGEKPPPNSATPPR
jgi:hypothetical protein